MPISPVGGGANYSGMSNKTQMLLDVNTLIEKTEALKHKS